MRATIERYVLDLFRQLRSRSVNGMVCGSVCDPQRSIKSAAATADRRGTPPGPQMITPLPFRLSVKLSGCPNHEVLKFAAVRPV